MQTMNILSLTSLRSSLTSKSAQAVLAVSVSTTASSLDSTRSAELRRHWKRLPMEGIQNGSPTEITRQDWSDIRTGALKQLETRPIRNAPDPERTRVSKRPIAFWQPSMRQPQCWAVSRKAEAGYSRPRLNLSTCDVSRHRWLRKRRNRLDSHRPWQPGFGSIARRRFFWLSVGTQRYGFTPTSTTARTAKTPEGKPCESSEGLHEAPSRLT